MKTQLKKGVMELLVLSLLTNKDRYGYEIVDMISQYVTISEGTIYPLFKRLQQEELVETYLVESPSGPPRKYYRITDLGCTKFFEMKCEWQHFIDAVDKLLKGVN